MIFGRVARVSKFPEITTITTSHKVYQTFSGFPSFPSYLDRDGKKRFFIPKVFGVFREKPALGKFSKLGFLGFFL
jgi:hypothetical protein